MYEYLWRGVWLVITWTNKKNSCTVWCSGILFALHVACLNICGEGYGGWSLGLTWIFPVQCGVVLYYLHYMLACLNICGEGYGWWSLGLTWIFPIQCCAEVIMAWYVGVFEYLWRGVWLVITWTNMNLSRTVRCSGILFVLHVACLNICGWGYGWWSLGLTWIFRVQCCAEVITAWHV